MTRESKAATFWTSSPSSYVRQRTDDSLQRSYGVRDTVTCLNIAVR
jgi:hypothetical protein